MAELMQTDFAVAERIVFIAAWIDFWSTLQERWQDLFRAQFDVPVAVTSALQAITPNLLFTP